LEEKRLLRKQSDGNDKRLVHLKPTAKGRRLVERAVPSASLLLGIDELSESERQATVEALRVLLRSVQRANSFKSFAPCHTCRFNQGREGHYLCGLTGEPLTAQDVMRICREHQYP
jgi:hypothetical protein